MLGWANGGLRRLMQDVKVVAPPPNKSYFLSNPSVDLSLSCPVMVSISHSLAEQQLLLHVQILLEEVQQSLLEEAAAFRDANIVDVANYEELKAAVAEGKWARGPWAGACHSAITHTPHCPSPSAQMIPLLTSIMLPLSRMTSPAIDQPPCTGFLPPYVVGSSSYFRLYEYCPGE